MSRLEFAPKIEEIKITDIKQGLGSFTPKPEKAVSFAVLKDALKKAGYTLASAEITVAGTLVRDDSSWSILVGPSKQRFGLEGDNLNQVLAGGSPGARLEITGDWKATGTESTSREVIRPRRAQKVRAMQESRPWAEFSIIQASFEDAEMAPPLTPIRTTSPGLTVYKGGAITPRYSYTRQHLGNLKIDRHGLRLNFSYTPTPTLQLEAEVPYQRSSFSDGTRSGSGGGFGNVTLWGKYRFFRTLETWGDKQAAVRFGLELPTGKKNGPNAEVLPTSSEFIRHQLTPIAGGLSAHADANYSKARGRFVYGANIEGILRSERDGFRLGHELRINTDSEYVLLPLKYRRPTNELFLILETTFVHRGQGRVRSAVVPESGSTEFFIAPALQYVPSARFLVEASVQFAVARSLGPQVLRTDRNILIGIRYLY